jgi:hypothetical protein
MRMRALLFGLLAALALGIAACGGVGMKSDTATTTKEQQLIDIKEAYESGVISTDAYERERQRILDAVAETSRKDSINDASILKSPPTNTFPFERRVQYGSAHRLLATASPLWTRRTEEDLRRENL